MASDDLFATGSDTAVAVQWLDGRIPIITVDGIYADPLRVRQAALALSYGPGTAHYPGRIARFPEGDPSLIEFLKKVAGLVSRDYLPRLPVLPGGRRLTALSGLDTDFAITDVHPDQLTEVQRRPHTDAVPVFGLIYLNEVDRGGTLFFKPKVEQPRPPAHRGYQVQSDEQAEISGRIEGRFNRLAIYPGFILHSAEVKGDWIESDERFAAPRLTQRIQFFA